MVDTIEHSLRAQSSDTGRVWTPRVMQAFSLDEILAMWPGADVCPTSDCGTLHAAGLYGDARIALVAHRPGSGFPDPVSLTYCPYLSIDLLT